jgi:membrane-bound serine protease (ClpP class)
VSPWLIGSVAVLAGLFFAVVVQAALSARRGAVTTGAESMIGSVGVALTELTPTGKVRVARETWSAVTDGSFVAAGTPVRVRAVTGVHVVVEPVADDLSQEGAGRDTAGVEGGTR